MADQISLPFKEIDPGTILYILIIVVAAYAIVKITVYLFGLFAERMGQRRLLVATLIPLIKVIVYSVAAYLVVVAVIEPTLSELVAFAGLFGAVLGFGVKDLFADIVGGLIITFEKPFQIGDKISVSGQYGEVTDIGLRSVRVTTPDDNQVTLPNYRIVSEATSSANAGNTAMMVVTDLYIDPGADAEKAVLILRDAVVTSPYVFISDDCPYTLLVQVSPWYVRLRAKAYVSDLRYEFEFRSDIVRRARIEFGRQDIPAPRPPPFEHSPAGSEIP
ncbi:mechanosensitive ion channel family protein [Methanofollis fontis]|uniref:Mechanosensitive ion channel protein MscS n=1 Tax=Methanofollis fontis TaxID=2052832 RepID=A0A483CR94_9EURY|nr:mechanosensitive ion channel domain-containing protein [Methanofollis fontis]TAJ43841.1 mechanosensitive ion channel protein MscS [Methanofollis fontis]